MPKPYGMTKKSDLEIYLKTVRVDVLPPLKELAETVGLSYSAVRAALVEWDANETVVTRVGKDWVRRDYCPDCSQETPEQYRHQNRLTKYHVFRTKFEGILVYATCPDCKVRFVSRNRAEYEQSA